MWWVGSTSLDIYIGTCAVALSERGSIKLVVATNGLDAGLLRLAEAMRALRGRLSLRVWLSGGLCRPFVVAPIGGARSQEDLRRIAHAVAAQETGLQEPCQLWLEERALDESVVVVAVQGDQLRSITTALTQRSERTRIARIAPWWSEALRASALRQPNAKALTVRDCDSLTAFALVDDRFVVATALTPVVDEQAADDAAARLLLMHAVEPREVVRVWFKDREVRPDAWSDALAFGRLTAAAPS